MKNERITQKQYILDHLRKYGFINPKVALRKFGVMRLSHIIYMLRREGYKIETEPTEDMCMLTGNRVCYATYRFTES